MYEMNLIVKLLIAIVILLVLFIVTAMLLKYRSIKNKEKRILIDLEEQKKTYDIAPDSGNVVYIRVGARDKIPQYVSGNIEKILGINKKTAYADIYSLKSGVASDSVYGFNEKLEKWDKNGTLEMEFEFTNVGNGENKIGKLSMVYIKEDDTYFAQISDITMETLDKRRLEKELNGIKSMNSYRNEFLSSLSHEVRTPINSILGTLQLAQAHAGKADMVEKYASNAAEQTNFLLSLLNNMFDISQLETGGVKLENTMFDLMAVAQKLRAMFSGASGQGGVNFSVEANDFNVRYLMGDALRLQQILASFVTRAQEAGPECTEISVFMRQMNNATDKVNIMFRIKDNGPELSRQQINSIFTPYEGESGGKVALAVSEQLIRMMGGQVIANSEDGVNSFTIFLAFPLADCEQDMTASVEGEGGAEKEFTYEGCRILLAEDNETNAEIAQELLEMQGASVDVAQNGVIAVDMYKNGGQGRYDVILMDIQMPEMDGWEATRRIRAIGTNEAKTIPIFALSANVFAEDKQRSIEVGMNGHVTKPIDFDELRKELAKYL